MRVRNCIRIYYMIPDSRGISIRMARVPEDWSLSGYVARQIGRVWEPFTPKSAGVFSEREVVQVGLDGVSQPMLRYRDELHLPDSQRSIVDRRGL